MIPVSLPPVQDVAPIDIDASLVEWAEQTCGADRVEVQWTGLPSSQLPSDTERLVWQGDPCRSRPHVRVAAVVDGVPSARFTVQPSLTLWATVPVAARDIAAGEEIVVVDAEVDLAKVVGLPVRHGTARTAIAAGRPVLESMIGVPFDAPNGSAVELVYVRGNLMIATDGRLLEDAKLGESVRVVNEASRAVAQGVLVSANRVEIAR